MEPRCNTGAGPNRNDDNEHVDFDDRAEHDDDCRSHVDYEYQRRAVDKHDGAAHEHYCRSAHYVDDTYIRDRHNGRAQ